MGSKRDRLIGVIEYFGEAPMDAAKSALALARSIIRKRELAAGTGQPLEGPRETRYLGDGREGEKQEGAPR